MMKKLLLLLVLAFSFQSGAASYDGLRDEALKKALLQEMRANHHSLGYKKAREQLMGRLTLQKSSQGYFIHDVYCDRDFGPADFGPGGAPAPGKIPDEKVLNTEHTWPQSRFGSAAPKDMQKSDLHHLFPADNQLNNIRGNHEFGQVDHADHPVKCNRSRAGQDAHGQEVFEPPVGHRGNVARALFYFSVRYQLHIDSDEEAILRRWNDEDPVTDEDRSRNAEIEKLQGNRNLFVDDPVLADRISDF